MENARFAEQYETVEQLAATLADSGTQNQIREAERRLHLLSQIRALPVPEAIPVREALAAIEQTLGSKRPGIRRFQNQVQALNQALVNANTIDFLAPDEPEPAAADPVPAASGETVEPPPAAPAPPPCPFTGSLAQDPQMIADFLVEAREHLVNIEGQLLVLEQTPENQESIHSAFRSFHTLKGLAGFLEFLAMQEVSHEVETILDLARNGKLVLEGRRIDVILHAGDYLTQWLNYIEAAANGKVGNEPTGTEKLIVSIRQAAEDTLAQAAVAEQSRPAVKDESSGDAESAAVTSRSTQTGSVVKVDTAKLEYLVDMVGELVIAQSMLHHNPDLGSVKTPRVQRDLAQLARVTGEVQKTAMAMRMVPIGFMFRRMNRLVRDLSRKAGKLVELELHGEDVELDRTIVEELADPIVHMLHNSLDHGLETPDVREAAGKNRTGRVVLKAWHQAGQVAIEISDDGRGLNKDKILAKAASRGLVDPGASLSDSDIYQLIFQPGFSTADKVTDVSGRGVGMDVVRKHVEKLRGRIDIESTPGQGTRFLLKLPLTLAIIDGLVVLVGGERYIVPLFAVREMFRPNSETLFTVENRAEMALVRERLLPVIRLYQKLGVQPKSEDPCEGLFIVGESGGRNFCLLVDELIGKQEVVIKSLGPVFEHVEGVAGGAILGDGRVGLILDVSAFA